MKQFLLFCVLFTYCLNSKSVAQSPTYGKYTFTTQPLQFLVRDATINVEKKLNRGALGITFGYRSDANGDLPQNVILRNFASNSEFSAPRFKGITLGFNYKYFLKKDRGYYLEGQAFYRYWWFNNRYYRTNHSSGDNTAYINSGDTKVVGLKLLFGYSTTLNTKGTVRPIMNRYIGLGFRYKIENEEGLSGTINYSIQTPHYFPYQDDSKTYLPSIQLGISFGISIYPKAIIN